MNEPARVTKVHPSAWSVEIPKYESMTKLFLNDADIANSVRNFSFSQRTLNLHKFGGTMRLDHESYYEISKEILDKEYQRFYNGLIDNCKDLFIKDPEFHVYYDALRHQDVASWTVYAGSDQIDYFKDILKCHERHYDDLAVREVTTVIHKYPQTLRDCLKQAWYIIKTRFRRN